MDASARPWPTGKVEQLEPLVRRVLAPNPSAFTYTGTQTYLIGDQAGLVVLDPGPNDPAHIAALVEAIGDATVLALTCTHTHRDHSPGVAALQAATGAASHGFGPHMTPPDQGGEGGDHAFRPDEAIADDATVSGGDWSLRAIHTPGHCANHLCFALEGSGILFSAR